MPEPVMHKFAIEIPAVPGTHYLDIGQIASLCNRKFYRQGMNWAVGNIEFWTNGDASMHITKLPNTWVMANAWVKGFSSWRESRNQVLDDNPSIEAKYSDFKIYYDIDHQVSGVANNLLPFGFATNFGLDDSYEWEISELEFPNDPVAGAVATYNVHALGSSDPNSKALISGYGLSRSRPNQVEPNAPASNSWMQQLFDVGDQLPEIREDVVEENASPPYLVGSPTGVNSDEEFYPGGVNQAPTMSSYIQDILVTRSGTSLTSDNSGPFLAPCGLLRLDVQHQLEAPSESILFLELVPGPVKGLMAQPMQEMN